MAKRFTDTKIWEEDWFLEMPKDYRMFWFYMKDKCNHAGIFRVNVKIFNATFDANIDCELAFELYNKGKQRLRKLGNGVWLIEDFFKFQYGQNFNTNNRVHKSVEDEYIKYEVKLTSIRGLKVVK
jgi:hypothetical protein